MNLSLFFFVIYGEIILRIKVIRNEEIVTINIDKVELISFAGDIFKIKTGLRTLKHLNLAVGYRRLKTNQYRRSKYYFVELTPIIKTLLRDVNNSGAGILKENNLKRKTLCGIVDLSIVLYLRKITREGKNIPLCRHIFQFMGCSLLYNGIVEDTFMEAADGKDDYRIMTAFGDKKSDDRNEIHLTDFLFPMSLSR